jgi:hypothetical protein
MISHLKKHGLFKTTIGSLATGVIILLLFANQAEAQYLGATCGYDYGKELTGPYSIRTNTSLYNPVSTNPNATWTDWAAQLEQAGVDFVCPNLEGSQPNTSKNPANMAPLVTILNNQGNIIKLAIFDDNATSWVAQNSQAMGHGFGTSFPFDISNTNNWRYIYDWNYKLFYQTVPDAQRFKINGRPLIMIWTGGTWAITNGQGNFSKALTYVRQCCQRDFGFNPFIVVSHDTLTTDTTCNNPSIIDGAHSWYAPPSQPGTLTTFNGVKIGALAPAYQNPSYSNYMPANHGTTLSNALVTTVGGGALLTLCEGFTDWSEECALLRVRNLDAQGNALTYNQTWYDFPNQRLALLRQFSRNPFQGNMLFEGEGCDTFGNAVPFGGKTNYFRNGSIGIETCSDIGGGWDVGNMQSGEWLEWQHVPLNSHPHFLVRVATPNSGRTAHFVIDGVTESSQSLPNTGGWQTWQTFDFGAYGTYTNSYHTVRIVFDNGGVNFNWWQL